MSKKPKNEDMPQSRHHGKAPEFYSVLNYWSNIANMMTTTNQSFVKSNMQLLNAGKSFYNSSNQNNIEKQSPVDEHAKKRAKPKIVTLENTGAAPNTFFGDPIISLSQQENKLKPWYEILVFEKNAGGYIAQIKTHIQSHNTVSQCFECKTKSELFEAMENYDVLCVFADNITDTKRQQETNNVLAALNTKLLLKSAQENYLAIVGDMLYELDFLLED